MEEESPNISPPKNALRLLRWFCHEHYIEEIEGDLEELFYERIDEQSERKAKFNFWWEVVRSCRPYFWKKTNPTHYLFIQQAMFKNYFKTTYRNLWRNKTFSAINIFGLSLSMSVCLLIIMLVKGQFEFDDYLENSDRIFRVTTHSKGKNNYNLATTTIPMNDLIANEITGVEKTTLFYRWFSGDAFANEKELPLEGKIADKNFLEILQLELKEGDPATALAKSDGIVLTYETAQKFFGYESALGKSFKISDLFNAPKEGLHEDLFTVTGVLAKTDHKSHIDFDALLSFELMKELVLEKRHWMESLDDWGDTYQNYVYLTLKENQSASDVEFQINQAAKKHLQKVGDDESEITFRLQNVDEITPYWGDSYSNQAGHTFPIVALLILGGISAVIMLSAIFNYTNLSMARSITRAKEIGIRKVNGASKGQVRTQFILEAVVLSVISLCVAIIFLQLLIPAFYNLFQFDYFKLELVEDPSIYSWFLVFAIVMGILAGIFPSFYIARLNAIQILKKIGSMHLMGRLTLRKTLIVIQFTLSMVFISSALLFNQQLDYVLSMDLGLKGENILEVNLNKNDYQLVKERFSQFPEVQSIAGVSHLPGGGSIYATRVFTLGKQDSLYVHAMNTTPNFIEQVKIKMVAGKFYDNYVPSQNAMRYIVMNEKAVSKLHYESASEVIGQQLIIGDSIQVEVIGVAADFMNKSVQEEVEPMLIYNNEDAFRYASIKINSENYAETIQKMKNAWADFDPIHPFTYRFFDKQIGEDFKMFMILSKLIGFAGFLAVVIAAIGFLGMAIFNTNNKLKEIAIRKVHGAQLKGLFFLLSKNFVFLMGIAAIVSTPLTYFLNTIWLEEFAKRTEIGVFIFAAAILLTLVVGLLTIAPQLWRVAVTNPADTLRNE